MGWPSRIPGTEDVTDTAFLPMHFIFFPSRQTVPLCLAYPLSQVDSGAVRVYLQMMIALSVFEENDLVHCWVLVPLLPGLAVI